MKEKVATANKSEKYWKNRFKSMVKKIMKTQNEKKMKKVSRKSYSEYSRRSKFRIKNEIREECQLGLNFMGLYDLVPTKVECFDPHSQKYEQWSLLNAEETEIFEMPDDGHGDDDVMQNMNKLDDVHFLLYVKDKFNISNKAWYELSSRVQNLPTVYGLTKRMQELNAQWHIAPTPGQAEGVQVKLEDSLLEHVPRLISSGRMKENDVLQLKISGDGTRVGKRLQLLNVTFTIINEGHTAATEKGNYVLAIIKQQRMITRQLMKVFLT